MIQAEILIHLGYNRNSEKYFFSRKLIEAIQSENEFWIQKEITIILKRNPFFPSRAKRRRVDEAIEKLDKLFYLAFPLKKTKEEEIKWRESGPEKNLEKLN